MSTTRPGDLSREAFVADVVPLIESAVGGPVALVGQSMGGHTAMLVAARRPDLVSKLVITRGQDVRRVDLAHASHDAHLDAPGPWVAVLKSFLSSQ